MRERKGELIQLKVTIFNGRRRGGETIAKREKGLRSGRKDFKKVENREKIKKD